MNKSKFKIIENLAMIIILMFSVMVAVAQTTPTLSAINVDSANTLIQSNLLNPNFEIIDLQSLSSYELGHIEKAISLDYGWPDFSTILRSLDRNKTYLIYCTAGVRSQRTLDSMSMLGFQCVYNMHEGFNTWQKNYPYTTSTSPTLSIYGKDSLDFYYVPVNQYLDYEQKITNGANDTLKILNISLSNNPDFSLQVGNLPTLLGYEDFSFIIQYKPTALEMDAASILIQSNAGDQRIYLRGHGSGVGIDKVKTDKEYRIFPNPAMDYLYIKRANTKRLYCNIYTINGKRVINKTLYGYQDKISVRNIIPGIYILEINAKRYKINIIR